MIKLHGLAILVWCVLLAGNAGAQIGGGGEGYRILVGYPPGGGTDTLTRQIAAGMAETLGQPVIVENRPGASGRIAGEAVSRAPSNGRLLLTIEQGFIANQFLMKDWGLVPDKDLTPISLMGSAPLILVVPTSVTARTLHELIALAKANPGKLTYGSAGSGNTTHLSPELLKFKAGLDVIQVPYKGSGPAVIDLLAGRISMMFTGISAVKGHIADGRLHPIAITGTSRSQVIPQVPTLAEAGVSIPELNLGTWWGLAGPPGMPRDVVVQIAQAAKNAAENESIRQKLAGLNIQTLSNTPEEFLDLIRRDSATYEKLLRRANIKLSN